MTFFRDNATTTVNLYGFSLLFTLMTLAEILWFPRQVWPAVHRSRTWWAVAGVVGVLLLPVGLVVSATWALRVRPGMARACPDLWPPQLPPSRRFYLKGVVTPVDRLIRLLVLVFAFVGLAYVQGRITEELRGDPATVYIVQLGHDITPASYILAACPNSVQRVGHLDTHWFPEYAGTRQAWGVTPLPGHLDRVLLDTDTGVVTCP